MLGVSAFTPIPQELLGIGILKATGTSPTEGSLLYSLVGPGILALLETHIHRWQPSANSTRNTHAGDEEGPIKSTVPKLCDSACL